jgi:BRCT domain type II-containing protein
MSARNCGAEIVKKLEEADYVVRGKHSGTKKNEEIAKCDVDVIDEEEFKTMLLDGVTDDKRRLMEIQAQLLAAGAEQAPQKKAKK